MRRKAETELKNPSKRIRTEEKKESKQELKSYTRKSILEGIGKPLLNELMQKGNAFSQDEFKNHILSILETAPFANHMFSIREKDALEVTFEDKSDQICRLLTYPIEECKDTSSFSFMMRHQRWDLMDMLLKLFPETPCLLHMLAYFATNSCEDNANQLHQLIKYYGDQIPNLEYKKILHKYFTDEFFFRKFIEDNSTVAINPYLPKKLSLLLKYKLYEGIDYAKHLDDISPWSLPTAEMLMQEGQADRRLKSIFDAYGFDAVSLLSINNFNYTSGYSECCSLNFTSQLNKNQNFFDLVQLLVKYNCTYPYIQLTLHAVKKNVEKFSEALISFGKKDLPAPFGARFLEFVPDQDNLIFFTKVFNQLKESKAELPLLPFLKFFGPFRNGFKLSIQENSLKNVPVQVVLDFLESSLSIIKKLKTGRLVYVDGFCEIWNLWITYLKNNKVDIISEDSIAQRYLAEFLKWFQKRRDYFYCLKWSDFTVFKAFLHGLERDKRNVDDTIAYTICDFPKLSLQELSDILINQSETCLSTTFQNILHASSWKPLNESILFLFLEFVKNRKTQWLKDYSIEISNRKLNIVEYLSYLNQGKHKDKLGKALEFLKSATSTSNNMVDVEIKDSKEEKNSHVKLHDFGMEDVQSSFQLDESVNSSSSVSSLSSSSASSSSSSSSSAIQVDEDEQALSAPVSPRFFAQQPQEQKIPTGGLGKVRREFKSA